MMPISALRVPQEIGIMSPYYALRRALSAAR